MCQDGQGLSLRHTLLQFAQITPGLFVAAQVQYGGLGECPYMVRPVLQGKSFSFFMEEKLQPYIRYLDGELLIPVPWWNTPTSVPIISTACHKVAYGLGRFSEVQAPPFMPSLVFSLRNPLADYAAFWFGSNLQSLLQYAANPPYMRLR
jgi:hypothetical protein